MPRPTGSSKFRTWLAPAGWLVAGLLAVYVSIDKLHPARSSGGPPLAPAPSTTAPPVESPSPTPTLHPYLYPQWEPTPSPPPRAGSGSASEAPNGVLPGPAPVLEPTPPADAGAARGPGAPAKPTPESRYGLDGERDKAAFLLPALDRLVHDRKRLAALEERYKVDCWGSVPSARPDDAPLVLSGTPACQRQETTIKELQDSLSRGCAGAREAAHRGGILPGILRELAAARGLEECLGT